MAEEITQGGAETPPAAAPPQPEPTTTVVAATQPVAKAEPPAPSPEQIARWKAMEAEHQRLRDEDEQRKAAAAKAEEDRLVEEGKLKEVIANKERLIADRDKKARESDARFKTTTRDSQLAFALARHPLTDGSPDQLLRLFRDDLEVVEDGESFRVQARDGRPVDQFVRDQLAHKDFAKFVRAETKGGAPRVNADRGEPAKAADRPDAEQRQVDSLRKSMQQFGASRLASVHTNAN